MKRRDVLKYVAFATGTAISSPLLSSFLSDKSSDFFINDKNYKSAFFDEQEFMLLLHISNTILPKTDSPSASEVGVPETIDSIISNVYSKNNQKALKGRFSALDVYLKRQNFLESNKTKKAEILTDLDKTTNQKDRAVRRAYIEIKQMVISYYLSSEEIAENYLNYLPVPGYYDPCVTVESVNGKAWSI